MADDEIMREVRAIREAYAARFGFDIEAIARDAKSREGKSGHPLVTLEPRRVAPKASAAPPQSGPRSRSS